MMFLTMFRKAIFSSCAFALIMGSAAAFILAASIPDVGTYLPKFQLKAPALEEERSYLGIGAGETFSINQIKYDLLLIEVVGVYCPQCHIQAPLFNDLFSRIKKNPPIFEKMKMFAIAAGANPTEVSYLKKQYNIPYPVIRDPGFEIHKLLGEPKTPFIMLIKRDEKIVFAHLGVIQNIDAFFLQIQKFLQEAKTQ
jgi:peroxiredoxin